MESVQNTSSTYTQNWPGSSWPDLTNGTQTASGDYDPLTFEPDTGPPSIIFEHCSINFPCANNWSSSLAGDYRSASYNSSQIRNADIVIKLQTGGKGLPNLSSGKNVWQVYVGATQYTPTNESDGSGPDVIFLSQGVDPTSISVNGKRADSYGYVYFDWQDNTEVDVTPKVDGANYYTLAVSPGKHVLMHQTSYPAFSNTNLSRTSVGVGESVNLYFDPALDMGIIESPLWSTTAGIISDASGSSTLLTAPDTETSADVKVAVSDVKLDVSFDVKKPSDIKYTKNGGDRHKQGWTSAGFLANLQLVPTDVSFYAAQIREDAASTTGAHGDWVGAGGVSQGDWRNVNVDNTLGPNVDHVASIYPSPGIHPGGYTWSIPERYRVQSFNADGYVFETIDHIFSADSAGTSTQTKKISTAPMPIDGATDWPF